MTAFRYEISKTTTLNGNHLELTNNWQGRESVVHSDFQALGLIYNLADAFVRHDSSAWKTASEFFTESLAKLGWDKDIARVLLSAPTWRIRMYNTWIFTGEWDKQETIKLDYTVFSNYWPNLRFLEPSWDDEVRGWTGDQLGQIQKASPASMTAWFDITGHSCLRPS